jgi:hypothetical protein
MEKAELKELNISDLNEQALQNNQSRRLNLEGMFCIRRFQELQPQITRELSKFPLIVPSTWDLRR